MKRAGLAACVTLGVIACGSSASDDEAALGDLDASTAEAGAPAIDAATGAVSYGVLGTPDLDATATAPDAGPLAAPLAAFAAMPPVCSSDGWCWWAPTPSGESYSRIVSSAPDNVWITGGGPPSYAAILQWNGHAWISHKPPMGKCSPGVRCEYAFPMSIATRGPDDTWLIYTNLTEHWDGKTWTIVDTETSSGVTVNGVWIDPDDDAWVTRSDGTVKRWHHGIATKLNAGVGVGSIWGVDSSDIFMTAIGSIVHYDGSNFSVVYSGGKTAGWYQGVKDDVWISGGEGAILHWNGTTVTEQAGAGITSQAVVQSADYAASDDVSWISSGASAGAEYFIHWNGKQLETTPITPAVTAIGDNLCGLLGSAKVIDGVYWIACGDGELLTRTGPSTIQSVVAPFEGVGNFWGTSVDDLYQSTGSALRHWNGTSWTSESVRIGGISGIAGAGVGGASELFGTDTTVSAADGGSLYVTTLRHFDGAAWASPLTLSSFLGYQHYISSVYPLGHDEAMIVGGQGIAFHYENGAITPIASGTTNDLISVWGPDADHLWIVGHNGTLLKWDRSNAGVLVADSSFPSTADQLHTITAAGGVTWISVENDLHVWMKPASGAWQQVNTKVAPYSFVALSATNVLVSATDSGILSRWNGATFEIEYYPSWRGLTHLYALPDGTTYLSGNPGIIVHKP